MTYLKLTNGTEKADDAQAVDAPQPRETFHDMAEEESE